MAKLPYGKKIAIKTLIKIMEDETTTVEQKLEACMLFTKLVWKKKDHIAQDSKEKAKKAINSLLGDMD